MNARPINSSGQDWTTPTVEEVAPAVFRVPLPLPGDALRAVNVYVIRQDDGRLTLIDSGWSIEDAREMLQAKLAEMGHGLADIDRFLVTHIHRDHLSLAIALRRDFGSRVALGTGERSSLTRVLAPGYQPMQAELARIRRFGGEGVATRWAKTGAGVDDFRVDDFAAPDEWISPGGVQVGSRALDAVETPGHTRGHVVFHDQQAELLFAGDHVLPSITPSIGFEAAQAENPLADFLQSLAVVRARPDATLLPAHGPVTASVHARIDELVAHHDRRLDQSERAVVRGAVTPREVAGQLLWTRRETSFDDLDVFSQMLAIGETAAHLDLLVAQERLRRAEVEGVLHYFDHAGAAERGTEVTPRA
jgi:glyoxylase-like metal-dependent hydrolase (beta-lactamase superfamily II)